MSTVWAQRREDLVSDCLVSPDVFHQMLDRLCAFVVPYQHALETETGQRNVHLYLQGLLSHLPGKNAERTLRRSSMWSDKSSKTSSAQSRGIIAR